MMRGNPPRRADDLRYTRQHEWLEVVEGVVTVGIAPYAADALGDVVFLDLPMRGAVVTAGSPCGEIESTKSVRELYSPVTGEVVEVNEDARADPSLVNRSPYDHGWLLRLTYKPPLPESLTCAEYRAFCGVNR